jgi:hypothetical protein
MQTVVTALYPVASEGRERAGCVELAVAVAEVGLVSGP